MKVCVIQPHYSFDGRDVDACFRELLALLDRCDESMDLIVLPEYSDAPADVEGKAGFYGAVEAYGAVLLQKARETARRCHALVFVNAGYKTADGVRNTTHAIDREGNVVGRYFKAHPAPSEVKTDAEGGHELDVAYSYEFNTPYVIEIEGLRVAFLTCYDFYFYENFARIARERVDLIIGCSLQRTDTHEALSIINKFLCYNTNAYLVRASVSLGADSPVCGCSMVVAPNGDTLLNMKNDVGLGVCEIDPRVKYFKPAGHMGVPKAHYEYIEEGRRPWLYRNGGASMVLPESRMPYPRLCACRGFSAVLPENTMPAFGAAVALGAEEIEFDLWSTADGVLVSCHDETLERVSNGTGKIYEHTYEELLSLDFGNSQLTGLKIATFEEILQKFAGRVVMNVHVKLWDADEKDLMIPEIVSLVRKYDCEQHIYFMSKNTKALAALREYAPQLAICVGWNGVRDERAGVMMVESALAIGAKKVQLSGPYFNRDCIELAHKNGIRCNVFFADEPDEARAYLDMGVDTLLTNNYLTVYHAVKDALKQ